ncbi:uncharacterized protein LOC136077616 [Hydra vulgaris]|uniref:Uncharacterized protein LOC136077616 n=1 Tax=Hydra vulgaris TaxID=6087 RepID=A0ABM4BG48_HYDVU
MFAIVAFENTCETDYFPLKWLDGVDANNIQLLITNQTSVKCYWPPFKNPNTIYKSKNNSHDAEINWPIYKARVLGLAGAVKLNPNTNQYNNKDIEIELSKWFSNARDRGIDGRRYTITKATMTTPSSD